MIGSHNSMSYLPPKHWLWRLFTPFWRCQDKTIKKQIDAGVRFFDIRVVWDRKRYCWQFAHGLVQFGLKKGWSIRLDTVLTLLETHGCLYRIVLERGTKYDENWFRYKYTINKYTETWWGRHPHCTAVIIKRGWETVRISQKGYSLRLDDRSFVPFHSDRPWWRQLSWRMLCTPRLWAKRHNTVKQGWKDDKDTVHFYDFATELKDE